MPSTPPTTTSNNSSYAQCATSAWRIRDGTALPRRTRILRPRAGASPRLSRPRTAFARDRVERARVSRAARFSARAVWRMAALRLDVFRRSLDSEPGGARDGGAGRLEKIKSARSLDRPPGGDAGADAFGQEPPRSCARKERRRAG